MTGFFGKVRERGYRKKGRRATSTEKKAVQADFPVTTDLRSSPGEHRALRPGVEP